MKDVTEKFIWASGIENSFVPHVRPRLRALDEYDLMNHYVHWREDLALVRTVGLNAVRWGIPWHRVEPERERFDWSWTDEVIPYLVEEVGVMPIIDLVHYGCPLWLPRAFDDPNYPEIVAAYAAAFCQRYRHLVHWYTPLNEPKITAFMCGRRGVWPPYRRGDTGYLRVLVQTIRGINRTVKVLREIDPDAVIVQIDAASIRTAKTQDLEPLAREDRLHTFLTFDFLTGLVGPEHPLFPWLLRSGVTLTHLREIQETCSPMDVMGLNFYPQWSALQACIGRDGGLRYELHDVEGTGFHDLLHEHFRRYQLPIMITETSALGSPRTRSRWLERSVGVVKALRQQGVPVIGYTWFPLFTMIDWRYRYGTRPLDHYRLELGLFSLATETGVPRWKETPLLKQLQLYIKDSEQSVGTIA